MCAISCRIVFGATLVLRCSGGAPNTYASVNVTQTRVLHRTEVVLGDEHLVVLAPRYG